MLAIGSILQRQKIRYVPVEGMHPPHLPPWIRHCLMHTFIRQTDKVKVEQ